MPWLIRAALANAPISVALTQEVETSTGVSCIKSTQTSLGRVQKETRVLDWQPRNQSHAVFGNLVVQARVASPASVETALRGSSQSHNGVWQGEVIEMHVGGEGWTSTQIWGFTTIDGCKKHTRRSVVHKGDEKRTVQLVYDWVGPNSVPE